MNVVRGKPDVELSDAFMAFVDVSFSNFIWLKTLNEYKICSINEFEFYEISYISFQIFVISTLGRRHDKIDLKMFRYVLIDSVKKCQAR